MSNIPSTSYEQKDLKRKSFEAGEELPKMKKVPKKTVGKPSEKSDYEKMRDQNVKERMDEAARLGL